MPEEKYKLTQEKYDQLNFELDSLSTKGRKKIADSLDWLRGLPNDKDDVTFSDVFEEQGFMEQRIQELKHILGNCDILGNGGQTEVIDIGSLVKVGFDRYEQEFLIVSALEADPINQKISNVSPVGKALLGHRIGDRVIVDTGVVVQEYRILDIK